MSPHSDFYGPNEGYILELYERFLENPETLDTATRQFFEHWTPPVSAVSNGATSSPVENLSEVNTAKIVAGLNFANAIRQYGHLAANIDPLGRPTPGDPALAPESHGITERDLDDLPGNIIGGPISTQVSTAQQAIDHLKEIYTRSIGYDNDHIRIPEEREWLREAIESRRYMFEGTKEQALTLLERLTQIEAFELFLQRSFPTKYRFSIEGLDMMVPMLDEVIRLAEHTGISTIAIAMAHRGRLNILAHIMNKPYDKILADFKDPLYLQEAQQAIGWTVGDVKYHKGVQRTVSTDQEHTLTITMPPNPSHLEAVNPVAVGMARAAGTSNGHPGAPIFDPDKTMQILIHGDAAFPGQGIVAETFNLSKVPGYWTGGTLHIIANNQIGFTTLPEHGRSTLYSSDLAKGFKVPIVHVNADDPAACIEVIRIAFAYLGEFEKDFLIDLVGYRRYGHNELDEPGFTQPKLYELVRQHPTVRHLWAEKLVNDDLADAAQPDEFIEQFNTILQEAHDFEPPPEEFADERAEEAPAGAAKHIETAVPIDGLKAINTALEDTLSNLKFYSRRMENTIRTRRKVFENPDEKSIDWATAEELAFASILEDGISIRLTGQDTQRGTFSHRHAVLHDGETGEELVPLQQFSRSNAPFEVHNSPLSEQAVLGFEFGYNVQASNRLVIWEAQYGDFANGAQNMIDEFVVSSREKWGQTPSLVMLLPHGHEGAGPDHSSARLERFLSLSAKTNMRVVNCTTAGQYFHLLRRQALLLKTDPLPLIIMAPKSLLRNPQIASSVYDLAEGKWQPVIDDSQGDPEEITRLVFVSGKFYYDLITSEHREKYPQAAVIRIEQLYPFPAENLREIIDRYPNATQIVWAQEEPKNMGAWEFMNYRIKKLAGPGIPVNYVGRRRSSSPAEGSKTAHQVNQSMITEYAFSWQFHQEPVRE